MVIINLKQWQIFKQKTLKRIFVSSPNIFWMSLRVLILLKQRIIGECLLLVCYLFFLHFKVYVDDYCLFIWYTAINKASLVLLNIFGEKEKRSSFFYFICSLLSSNMCLLMFYSSPVSYSHYPFCGVKASLIVLTSFSKLCLNVEKSFESNEVTLCV